VLPFRAQARADVTPRERLESINREEGREGVRAFKSAAETIRKIESTRRPSPGPKSDEEMGHTLGVLQAGPLEGPR